MENKVNGIKGNAKMPPASAPKKLHPQNSPISTPSQSNVGATNSQNVSEKNAKQVIRKNAFYSAEAIAAAKRQRGSD